MIELHITDSGIIKTVYSKGGEVTSSITFPTESNLPDDIRTKLSALKLMAVPDDVPDVGQKVSDTLYWIYEGELGGMLMSMIVFARAKSEPLYKVPKGLVNQLKELQRSWTS